MSNVSITPLSMEQIREICEKDGALYVVNYTDRGLQRNRGNLHVSFVDETGNTHGIVFPNTWIPIDAAAYASSKQLIKSQTFLAAIRSTDIVVISESEAKQILSRPDAREETKKVATKYAGSAGIVSATPERINIFNGDSGAAPAPDLSVADTDGGSLSDSDLNSIVEMFKNGGMSDRDAASRIDNLIPRPSEDAIIKAMNTVVVTTSETYKALMNTLNSMTENTPN